MEATATRPEAGRIGVRLLQLLARRGWSLSRLARETKKRGAEVSLSQLSLLTRGEIDQPRFVTIARICAALDIPDRVLLSGGDSTERIEDINHRHFAVTTFVEVVRCSRDGGFVETGERVGVAVTLLDGHERLLAAVIDGGGMGPHILIGDRVVFDPDGQPQDREVVLLLHGPATICAWYVLRDDEASYRLADGSWLRADQVQVVGTVVYVMRSPPAYLP